ncbi:MAG: hypothetical protein H0W86_12565 [Armatimonadetes bacterium]|nr:hypothetical protein [Armatimonadota bacterium]
MAKSQDGPARVSADQLGEMFFDVTYADAAEIPLLLGLSSSKGRAGARRRGFLD